MGKPTCSFHWQPHQLLMYTFPLLHCLLFSCQNWRGRLVKAPRHLTCSLFELHAYNSASFLLIAIDSLVLVNSTLVNGVQSLQHSKLGTGFTADSVRVSAVTSNLLSLSVTLDCCVLVLSRNHGLACCPSMW